MCQELNASLAYVTNLNNCAAFQGLVSGRMNFDYVEVSDRVKSINYFLNMAFTRGTKHTLINEFVWDPINRRFAAIFGSGKCIGAGDSPHEGLARRLARISNGYVAAHSHAQCRG